MRASPSARPAPLLRSAGRAWSRGRSAVRGRSPSASPSSRRPCTSRSRSQAEGIRHIHANWASHPAMSAWVMSRLTGASWSFAGHASDIYLDRTMLREKIQAAKFVVTCTRHNKDYLAGIGGERVGGQDRGELPRRGPRPVQARPAAGRRRVPDPDGGNPARVQGAARPHRGLPPPRPPAGSPSSARSSATDRTAGAWSGRSAAPGSRTA